MLAYNGVHLLVLLAFGVALSWLADLSERFEQAWYLIGSLAPFIGAHFLVVPVWLEARSGGALPLGMALTAAVVGLVAMGTFLWLAHPGIRAAAHKPDEGA